jgi:drug/metabolite transporter (DMT)-like permease
MLDPVFGFFEKLIDQFTWRRLAFLTLLLVIGICCLWIFETYTQSFKLTRIERQVALLGMLSEVASQDQVRSNPEFQAIAISLTEQLRGSDVTVIKDIAFQPWMKKALATAAVWIIFFICIASIPNKYSRTSPEFVSVLAGMTLFALPFIALSTLIPTNPWLNYLVYPIGHLFVLAFLMLLIGGLMTRRLKPTR